MSTKLSVIILSWNVRDLLRRALETVFESWGSQPGLEVIVVDNASSDDSVAMVRSLFPQVQLLVNPENQGFTGGNNQGLRAATGDLLFLLNSDTEVLGSALSRMVTYVQQNPDVGLIGPQLLNVDGSVQSSRRRFPSLPILFLESTWLQGLTPPAMLRRYYAQDLPVDEPQDVDWVTGAALLVRREVFAEIGGLDEGFFMYSEELDWCRRIKQAGWRVVYYPDARVIHYGGKSSEQVVPARHIYFQSSKVRYARKYHGPFVSEALRLWLMAQYVWQLGVEGLKWLVGHRRELRSERIMAYTKVLKSRLQSASLKDP